MTGGVAQPRDQVRAAKGARNDDIRGTLVYLVHRPALKQSAMAQHGNTVGKAERLVLIVGNDDDPAAACLQQTADSLSGSRAQVGIEVRERLVEQDQTRLKGQRPGKRHPLLLSAGKLVREPVLQPAQPTMARSRGSAAGSLHPKRMFSATVMWGKSA